MRQDTLIRPAETILYFNWAGGYTRSGPRLCRHRCSWDSVPIAIGYARYDRAATLWNLEQAMEVVGTLDRDDFGDREYARNIWQNATVVEEIKPCAAGTSSPCT